MRLIAPALAVLLFTPALMAESKPDVREEILVVVKRARPVDLAALRIDVAVKIVKLLRRAQLCYRKLDTGSPDRCNAQHWIRNKDEPQLRIAAKHVTEVYCRLAAIGTVKIVKFDQRYFALRVANHHYAGQAIDRS